MKKKVIFLLAGFAFVSPAFAGGPELIPTAPNTVFITIGAGYSWSQSADIDADTADWDASPQGYDSNVDNSLILSAESGYIINSLFSIGAQISYRGDYSYEKFQTSTAVDTDGFLGSKTRFFDLTNTAFLGNLYLNKFGAHHYLSHQFTSNVSIFPFVGAGVGMSYNTINNFHSVLPDGSVSSLIPENTEKSLAYQAMAGLVLEINKTLSIDASYRYFNGGDFKSQNYVSSPDGTTETVSPWTGNLSANEVLGEVNFSF